MNLSLGWDGAAWGDLDPADKSNKGTVADIASSITVGDQGVPANVRAALAASMVASCEGAMMVAAVGNGNSFTCDGGRTGKASWPRPAGHVRPMVCGHLVRRVAVEREDTFRVEGQIASEPVWADAREDELDCLQSLLVHARWQRRVQALVQPLRH